MPVSRSWCCRRCSSQLGTTNSSTNVLRSAPSHPGDQAEEHVRNRGCNLHERDENRRVWALDEEPLRPDCLEPRAGQPDESGEPESAKGADTQRRPGRRLRPVGHPATRQASFDYRDRLRGRYRCRSSYAFLTRRRSRSARGPGRARPGRAARTRAPPPARAPRRRARRWARGSRALSPWQAPARHPCA